MRLPLSFLFIIVLLFCLTVEGADTDTSWPCQFTFDGYYYDLTPGNENPNSSTGVWYTSDINNDYFFKLCEPTTKPPGSAGQCASGTQVCQQDYFKNDYGCGFNPTTSSFGQPGAGVVMHATNGDATGCARGRESILQVLCPTDGFSSGSFGPVSETEACVYTIPFYHDVGCPTRNPSNPDALISLYQSTNGPNWKNNTNWLSILDPTGCSWYGVTCDSDDIITGLSLYDNKLSGTLPSDFGTLESVQNIFLQNNSLSGSIPDLSNVRALVNLYLSDNLLSGPFPNVTSLPSLAELDLHLNKLSGNVPYDICNVAYFNILDNAWDCPLPPCCQSPVYEKTRCGSCQWP